MYALSGIWAHVCLDASACKREGRLGLVFSTAFRSSTRAFAPRFLLTLPRGHVLAPR